MVRIVVCGKTLLGTFMKLENISSFISFFFLNIYQWKSGESGMSYEGPIYVHMNFDDYRPIPMTADLPGLFVLRRMCPPSSKLLYFFSTPEGDSHAKD